MYPFFKFPFFFFTIVLTSILMDSIAIFLQIAAKNRNNSN